MLMILKFSLNIQIIWMIFLKILKNTTQVRNAKYFSYLVIRLLICLVIKKLHSIVTELFIRGKKLNISLVFVTQSYFAVPKNIRMNSTYCFIVRITNK